MDSFDLDICAAYYDGRCFSVPHPLSAFAGSAYYRRLRRNNALRHYLEKLRVVSETEVLDIIESIMDNYSRDRPVQRLCPPNLDALNNVKASAAFLTDLDENNDIG